MSKPLIKKIAGREILDSRGNPTLEVTVVLTDDTVGLASVPSGASTGKYEAHERRDGDPARYGGRGVLEAAEAVNRMICPALSGKNAAEQYEIDDLLFALDGTENKAHLGANTTLAVSLAIARAAAAHYRLPLYRYLGGISALRMPMPMMNILNGGAHAGNNIDIQEFMILPTGFDRFAEALRAGSEIYHTLGGILRAKGHTTTVGDEGGYAPDLDSDEAALDLIEEAIAKAGFGGRVEIALDAAASEWHKSGNDYHLPKRDRHMSRDALIDEWARLAERHPIRSIEDPLGEEDFAGFTAMTQQLGDKLMLVGDDLFVTNKKRLLAGIAAGAGNAILIKPNQIGTLTETLSVIDTAKEAGFSFILSHRSGETEDTTIADLAVATGAPFIKAGAPCRSERVAKYNRLLRIEAAFHGR